MCLIELKIELIEEHLSYGTNDLHRIQFEIGMTRDTAETVDVSKFRDYNLVPVSQKISRLSVFMAKCDLSCETHLQLLEQLVEQNQLLMLHAPKEQKEVFTRSMKVLERRQNRLKFWMKALQPRIKNLDRRSQAYVQTVSDLVTLRIQYLISAQVYSLMAQKDNALNIQTAEASLRVSEASYRDSTAMIQLADDSKQVAIATSRDSSLMSIISVLTLIYLPSTFTAVS